MSSQIQIAIDGATTEFRQGDPISGTIVVDSTSRTTCRRLVLTLGWRTSGKGSVDEVVACEHELFRGPWEPGECYEYPFDLTAPRHPCGYDGELVSIDWTLSVRAWLPMKRDWHAQVPIQLGRSRTPSTEPPTWPHQSSARSVSYTFRGLYTVLLACGGLFIGSLVFEVGFLGLAMGTMLGLITLLVLYVCVQSAVNARRLGKTKLEIATNGVQSGGQARWSFALTPPKTVELYRVTVCARAFEEIERSDDRDATRLVFEVSERLGDVPAALQARRRYEFSGVLRIPAEAPLTFYAPNNRLEWRFGIELDLPGPMDFSTETVFLVYA